MGIDANLVDELREIEEQVDDSAGVLSRFAQEGWPRQSDTVCLRFIDPWGDTVFNQAQLPILLAELRKLEREQSDELIKAHLGAVVRLVERAQGRVHMYIEFAGD